MSNNYDNWERLVEAVLKREELRRVALLDESRESSFYSDFSFRSSSNAVADHKNLDIFQPFDHQQDIMISTSVTPLGNESQADLHQLQVLEREQVVKKFQEVTVQLEQALSGIEPSRRPSKTTSAFSPAERKKIEALLHKLTAGNPEDQRSAAGEIRLLAKRNADNRVAIAEAGAIPLLIQLLSTSDSRTQEHAVSALLKLSMCEDNKRSIVSSGAVPGIVHVLKKGSMEARENAAATLFSLSVMDQNKITIGASGAIPPLVTLLNEGTPRGKKDAAVALSNLCIHQGNKRKTIRAGVVPTLMRLLTGPQGVMKDEALAIEAILANKRKTIRAGVVPTLMRLLTEPQGGMKDEALAILAILARHPEGKAAIGAAEAVPALVDVIGNGSPRNKENAAAVLVHLCSGDQHYLVECQELGAMGPLIDLAANGRERGKRKATQLLERMNSVRKILCIKIPISL